MLNAEQQARLQEGVRFHLAGRYDEAERIYQPLHVAAPDDFQVNHLFGALRQQQERPAEALPLLQRALRKMPLYPPTLVCLGVTLRSLGRNEEAEAALAAAVKRAPRSHEAWANLGAVHATMGRLDQAITAYRRALKLKPDYAQGWVGMGSALHLAGRSTAAIRCHNLALKIEPENRKARFARGQALQACSRIDEALADFDAHLKLRPDHVQALSYRLFLLNYRDDLSREAVAAEHAAYGRAMAAAAKRPSRPGFGNAPDPDRRLRVAFLSPDLRAHSVAYFIEPLLARLDRSQFEVVLYHDHYKVDAVSERLRAGAGLWRSCAGLAADELERIIRADAPDLLVDLAGHTGFNRMELFARRLAPVQITYLGYPNTTGLSAMDYRFTDGVADPFGQTEALHTERLVRFSPVAWAYAPPPSSLAGAPALTPRGRPPVFGSFNLMAKVNGATLRLWRELLETVPESRLLLKSSGMEPARWCRRLAEAGFPIDRVELRPMAPNPADHFAAYAGVDVALDPFPYNGTTTTCEALWMGVPVVTLAGDRHSGRVGASLLTALGRPEWIASTPRDYIRIAADLAAAGDYRRDLRTHLRKEMTLSKLLDHAGQAECFGAGLRACWNEWCAAQEPSVRAEVSAA